MIDWNDAFDNSGYVPGSDKLPETWSAAAAAFRKDMALQGRAQFDIAYGAGQREKLDIFFPQTPPKGHVIFVHGGYWHRLDKSYWSHLARGCLHHGWTFIVPSYPLAPDARVSAITQSVAAAVAHVATLSDSPLRLAGHSAGGHLVARMICEGCLPVAVIDRLARVVSISGVHLLEPLVGTEMNETLGLTLVEAKAESPAGLQPLKSVPASFWVGAEERPEFLRQTRAITETWTLKGADCRAFYEPDLHHFNVIESLAEPLGSLTNELLK